MSYANTRVFIGGLEGTVTKEDIEAEFSKFGKLTNVWVAQNPPGFAFIIYESEQDAEQAVSKMNGETFMGAKVRVEHSKPKRRNLPRRDYGTMRGGRSGNYGDSSGPYNGGGGGGGGSGRYSGGGGGSYGGRGYGGGGDGESRGDRGYDRGGYGKSNYQSNGGAGGGNYRDSGRRGGYESRQPREYREYKDSDRHSPASRYD